MQCPCPVSIRDPRGNHNSVRLTVPCNLCPVCLQNKRADWSFRLNEELRTARNAWFLTLTYSDKTIPSDYGLSKRDLQLFHKRLRKQIAKHNGYKMRYYAVGEYGTETRRPHYHGIYYNIPLKVMDEIENIWQNGQTHFGTCTPASIHYVTKYVIQEKTEEQEKENPFALMSRRPALGSNYLPRNEETHIKALHGYVVNNGFKQKIPKYYKDKIFTESEREKIAQEQIKLREQKWLENYEREFYKTTPEYIENKFRTIRKTGKSK